MIFVDTNVFMYAVGVAHPNKLHARDFLSSLANSGRVGCTSAEVLQEMAHVYLRSQRPEVLDSALALVHRLQFTIWPLEESDVLRARKLYDEFPGLQARDLCHLASCQRRAVEDFVTFDNALQVAADHLFRPPSDRLRLQN